MGSYDSEEEYPSYLRPPSAEPGSPDETDTTSDESTYYSTDEEDTTDDMSVDIDIDDDDDDDINDANPIVHSDMEDHCEDIQPRLKRMRLQ